MNSTDWSTATVVIKARLRQLRIVPVVELPELEVAVPLAQALIAGGLPVVEITFRTPAAEAGLAAIRQAYPDILLGAGTIIDGEQISAAIAAGADFIVSPGINPEIVKMCVARGIPILPGVCTPSEIEMARSLGVHVLKFFPAEPIGGAAFLRALCGPYRDVSFIPTGSITPKVLLDYLAISQVLACGGSWMVKPDMLRARDFVGVRQVAEDARVMVQRAE